MLRQEDLNHCGGDQPHREEFVVVGWTDPEGARPWLGALLLAYYDPDGNSKRWLLTTASNRRAGFNLLLQ